VWHTPSPPPKDEASDYRCPRRPSAKLKASAPLLPSTATRGAKLDGNLRAHLEDFITMKEFDGPSINSRIDSLTPKLCTVELRPVLPPPLFERMAKEDFEPIRRSVRTILSDLLKESRR
jgi:hypothetical protein